jgi:hypothetical protein
MRRYVGRAITWTASTAALLSFLGCGTPKHVAIAPARGDSYACARAKVVDLGLEIFDEDTDTQMFQAIRSMTLIGADNDNRVVFDQLQVRVKHNRDAAGNLEITVTAGMLQRGVIGGVSIGNSSSQSSVSFVTPKDQPPTEKGIADATAVMEACSIRG